MQTIPIFPLEHASERVNFRVFFVTWDTNNNYPINRIYFDVLDWEKQEAWHDDIYSK